jgi:hypothetical protein
MVFPGATSAIMMKVFMAMDHTCVSAVFGCEEMAHEQSPTSSQLLSNAAFGTKQASNSPARQGRDLVTGRFSV